MPWRQSAPAGLSGAIPGSCDRGADPAGPRLSLSTPHDGELGRVSHASRCGLGLAGTTPESAAFNREVELADDRQNEQTGDGIVCGVSGWFSPHGVRYHQDIRSVSQIAPADWSALLDHADAINFFDDPEPARAVPSDRIFHLAITAGNRIRELAINDPFKT